MTRQLTSHVGLTVSHTVGRHTCLICGQTYEARAVLQHTVHGEVIGRVCPRCTGPHFRRIMAKLERQEQVQ